MSGTNDRILIFPRGSVIQFTTGEYSDFTNDAFLITIKDCDLPELAQKFVRVHVPEDEWDKAKPTNFAGWLIANGYAMPGECQQVHLGSYGEWEPEFRVET